MTEQGMETAVLLLHQRSWQYMVGISVPDAELTYLLSTFNTLTPLVRPAAVLFDSIVVLHDTSPNLSLRR